MKKHRAIIRCSIALIASLFILGACGGGFSVGTKTDALTGFKVNYKGLSMDDSYLIADGTKLKGRSVALGSEVVMLFDGVDNFTTENGMTYPGASMLITGPEGEVLLDEKDLFSRYSEIGVSKEDAETLSLTLTFTEPMQSGTEYTWISRIWDKKGDGEIQAKVKLTAK